ncbi:MAG: CubicO group peptidase (beta-lactamase class C family) [Bacteroidia bacterium]|jgi:CubicO group peptidase (beta-lactamase class C family)
MNRIKKILKRTAVAVVSLVALVVLFILISGNHYMFFMLRHTVLEGRMGPTVDEHVYYDNNVVAASETPFLWPIGANYETNQLSATDEAYHETYQTKAFLVVHHGEIQYEQYWDDYSDSSKTNSWSMAKSVCSHLIGCALQDGLIQNVDQKISDFLPDFKDDTITTLRNVLTMSTGYDWYESYQNPFGFTARSLYGNDTRTLMKRYDIVDETGTTFNYKSANSQLLGLIISSVTGKTVSAYASEKLWKPIGAKHNALWSLDHDQGDELAYCCFNTNIRDYAKFGKLYLNKGIVNGDTLIPAWYYEEATKPTALELKTGGPNDRYGFQWWCSGYEGEPFFYAHGINGQYILILPDSDLIVVRLGQSRPHKRIKGHPVDIYEYLRMAKNMIGSQGS